MDTKYKIGLFTDEEILLKAVKNLREEGIKITDAFTPFPVHGLDHAMGIRETRLHTVGFIFGSMACVFALSFMIWANSVDYPLNIGGKPYASVPAFIPITFEFTVLTTSISMVVAFFVRCGLSPAANKTVFDPRTTDDHFALTFEYNDDTSSEELARIDAVLNSSGAVEIREFDPEDAE